MITQRQLKTWAFGIVIGVGLSLPSGCGDDTGLGKRYPVTGTVNYNGQPVVKGQINFQPIDEGKQRTANGFIQDGQYSLTTAITGDGALPGDYKVTVTALETDDSQVQETIKKYGGGGRQHEIGKATASAKRLVPAKYQTGDTSGLKATVKEQSNTLNFELTD